MNPHNKLTPTSTTMHPLHAYARRHLHASVAPHKPNLTTASTMHVYSIASKLPWEVIAPPQNHFNAHKREVPAPSSQRFLCNHHHQSSVITSHLSLMVFKLCPKVYLDEANNVTSTLQP